MENVGTKNNKCTVTPVKAAVSPQSSPHGLGVPLNPTDKAVTQVLPFFKRYFSCVIWTFGHLMC